MADRGTSDEAADWGAVDTYFIDTLGLEDAALVAARESSSETTMPDIEVTATQGALLALLTRMCGARRVLEFGTLTGYSAIWFARAVGEGGRVVSLELEELHAEIARRNFELAGVSERIDVLVGSAAASAQGLIDEGVEPFDLVFIDADKQSTPLYLAAAMEMTRPGAAIVIDNVVRGGGVVEAESQDPRIHGIREATAAIAADPRLDATAIQTVGLKGWDGLIVALRAG